MSTGKNNSTAERFSKLAKMGEIIFHTQDLANLWQIQDKNNLYTTLKRYVKKGLLTRVHKGFYTLKDINDIDPFLLGVKFLNCFAYISTETVLVEKGIIFQSASAITIVSSKSKKFLVGGRYYKVRKLKDDFLYNMSGIELVNGYYKANPERAVADLLYFNPDYYFDGQEIIDWQKVRQIQKKVGYSN